MTLHLKQNTPLQPQVQGQLEEKDRIDTESGEHGNDQDVRSSSISCSLCGATFQDPQDQRLHIRSDWHGYNLKQKIRGLKMVNEIEFDKLVEGLDESISGSDSEKSDEEEEGKAKDTTLSALLKRQAKLHQDDDPETSTKQRIRRSSRSPLIWFSTSLLPSNTSLGIYRALFTEKEQQESMIIETLRRKQFRPVQARPIPNANDGVPLHSLPNGPSIFLCMIGGGHFAAMIVSLNPKVGKKANGIEERQAIVLAHKTFHRYTTRRKQGGSQSANDSAKGAAHSAGAGIRRYNEAALETEVRALLAEWKSLINGCELLFVRATGTTNRRTLFGPYENQVLHHNDPRNRSFPFSTRRATQAELMRAFVELTRVKVSQVDEAALAAAAAEQARKEESASKAASSPNMPAAPKPSKEEEAALLHTSQLQALIRRSKVPAVLSYLSGNLLSPDFIFQPASSQANHHASTPLHLAASTNSPAVVLALLVKAGADPSVPNAEGKPAFDLAGDRATRDAFRVARSELGEDRWHWENSRIPPAMTKAEADRREQAERQESEKAELDRRRAETERLKQESIANGSAATTRKVHGNTLRAAHKTGAELREQEARGMTPEMRTKLERERRARAAEERIRRMAGGVGGGGAGR